MFTRNTQLTNNRLRQSRRGAVTVLAAIFSIVALGLVALSVDIGYMLSMKEEMQRTADAAALAACWEYGLNLSEENDQLTCEQNARLKAASFAGSNWVGNASPAIDMNSGNSASGDLVFGYVQNLYSSNPTFDTTSSGLFNAVKVRIRRDSQLNGEAPTFFARVFGHYGQPLYANATAALIRDVSGYRTTTNGENLDLLPFTLDLPTWQDWMAKSGPEITDDWHWDPETKTICEGPDGIYEVNLYPQGTGSPGNRGTLDIGSNNNSTNDIERQILCGVSNDDLDYHGGSLQFDECGKLYLNGDTGISAGVKDELIAIKGEPRCIPIFSDVHNPGNNAMYTIVKWQGIRIMDVQLSGPMKKKHVTIQPAACLGPGVIPSTTPGTSSYVYSPAVLIE